MGNARLVIEGLGKSYASPVLTDVNLTVEKGEIHALVGENGAGKTTLVNILTGLVDKDAGHIELDDKHFSPSSPREAFSAGVSVATQELSIIGTMSIAENLSLKALPAARGVLDRDLLIATAEEELELVGLERTDPWTRAEQLSLSGRQLVELAKAMRGDNALLILDEPTAALTAPQAERLHDRMRERASRGTSVIYISHRLNDVLDVADTVSVLRDGRVVLSGAAGSLTVDELVSAMAGRAFQQGSSGSKTAHSAAPVIRARSLTTDDLPVAIDFEAKAGEIVGLAGLAGAGRSELLHALFGLSQPRSGSVVRIDDGAEFDVRSAKRAVGLGIAMLGEDRRAMGLFEGRSLTTNLMIPGADGSPALIDRALETAASEALAESVDIRCESVAQDIAELSGGNQQKALLGRWLHRDADVYLLDEPTRGVDVATKAAIYGLLEDLARAGKCIVVASSENEELLALCDRIIVLSNRRIAAEFNASQCSEEDLLTAAFSGFTGAQSHRRGEPA